MRGARNGCRFPARTETLHDATTAAPNDIYGLNATDSKAQTVAEAARMFTRRLCASPPLADFSQKIRQAHVAETVIWRNGPLFGQCGIAEKGAASPSGRIGETRKINCLQTDLGRLHGFFTDHGSARLLDISSPLCARELPRQSSTGLAEKGRLCCKSRKLQVYKFFAKTQTGKQSPIRITFIALPKSPVSLA
jgi:hypothetical protein